jgi:IPT/TIG domain
VIGAAFLIRSAPALFKKYSAKISTAGWGRAMAAAGIVVSLAILFGILIPAVKADQVLVYPSRTDLQNTGVTQAYRDIIGKIRRVGRSKKVLVLAKKECTGKNLRIFFFDDPNIKVGYIPGYTPRMHSDMVKMLGGKDKEVYVACLDPCGIPPSWPIENVMTFKYKTNVGLQSPIVFARVNKPQIAFTEARIKNNILILSGWGFGSAQGTSSVTLGSLSCPDSNYISRSDAKIQLKLPMEAYGNVRVVVHTPLGDSNDKWLGIPPKINVLIPTRVKAGSSLIVRGSRFGDFIKGRTWIEFGKLRAEKYYSWSNTSVEVEVPSTVKGSVRLRVKTCGGKSTGAPLYIENGQ